MTNNLRSITGRMARLIRPLSLSPEYYAVQKAWEAKRGDLILILSLSDDQDYRPNSVMLVIDEIIPLAPLRQPSIIMVRRVTRSSLPQPGMWACSGNDVKFTWPASKDLKDLEKVPGGEWYKAQPLEHFAHGRTLQITLRPTASCAIQAFGPGNCLIMGCITGLVCTRCSGVDSVVTDLKVSDGEHEIMHKNGVRCPGCRGKDEAKADVANYREQYFNRVMEQNLPSAQPSLEGSSGQIKSDSQI